MSKLKTGVVVAAVVTATAMVAAKVRDRPDLT